MTGEAGLLLLAWGLSRWMDISPLQQLRPTLSALVWGIAATGPLLLGLRWVLTTRWTPARDLVSLVVDQLGPLLAGRSVLELGALAVLAGVSEEILFRGVLQAGLGRILPEVLALGLASALFGLVHFVTREYALLAGVMGLYLGTLFLLQGSLLAPIVSHALYDFVALVYVAHARPVSPAGSPC
jgi:CAAX protease family protein